MSSSLQSGMGLAGDAGRVECCGCARRGCRHGVMAHFGGAAVGHGEVGGAESGVDGPVCRLVESSPQAELMADGWWVVGGYV